MPSAIGVNLYDTPDFVIPGTNPNEQPAVTGCFGASQPPGDGTWRIRILAYMPCKNSTGCAFRMMLAPSSAYGDTTPLTFNTLCGKSGETFLTPGSSTAWPGGPTWRCGDPFWIPFDNPMFDRCFPTFPHPIVTPL